MTSDEWWEKNESWLSKSQHSYACKKSFEAGQADLAECQQREKALREKVHQEIKHLNACYGRTGDMAYSDAAEYLCRMLDKQAEAAMRESINLGGLKPSLEG